MYQNYIDFENYVNDQQLLRKDLEEKLAKIKDVRTEILIIQYLENEDMISQTINLIIENDIKDFFNLLNPQYSEDIYVSFINTVVQKHKIQNYKSLLQIIEKYDFSKSTLILKSTLTDIEKKAVLFANKQDSVIEYQEKEITLEKMDQLSIFLDNSYFVLSVIPTSLRNLLNCYSLQNDHSITEFLISEMMENKTVADIFHMLKEQGLSTKGKIIKNDSLTFHFATENEALIFKILKLEVSVSDSNALFIELIDNDSVSEVDGQLYCRLNKIEADIETKNASVFENGKFELMTKMATAISTIGKIISRPEVKIAIALVSAIGVMDQSFAGDVKNTFSEGEIAKILNKLEKVHTINGFEHGKVYKEIDSQLESIGLDLADVKLNSSMTHRSINFFGEEGDYTLKIGGSSIQFKVDDSVNEYKTFFKSDGIDRGIISDAELKEWGSKITNKLNQARKLNVD